MDKRSRSMARAMPMSRAWPIRCRTSFPWRMPCSGRGAGSFDAFVIKLNPTGTGAIYSTYWGGVGDDRGQAIAVDAAGNAHVTGMTSSVAFPISNAVKTQHSGGTWDVFAVKLNAAGTAAFYSTYLGGTGDDRGQGIVLDGAGGAIIGGLTASAGTTLGTTAGVVQPANAGGTDAFVAKLTDTGIMRRRCPTSAPWPSIKDRS